MNDTTSTIEQRLRKLETHLEQENPVLLQVVKSFRTLDGVAYALGLLDRSDSYATRVPWWPLISILGTFSSGKSTFINNYLGESLQLTGNQAVDDKFTVICYSSDETGRVLPGLALDADPRFPFYRISGDIEKVASGEGRRLDAYLQLKTSTSDVLRGKILIDSPGFDADEQRTSVLRITDHILDLSDLVLVFFDARHPEPGAMQDTLEHLVANTIRRADSNKFLYILNQIDITAREDNPEEVFAAWQRALAQKGLTAGRFYRVYDPEAAVPIEDESRRRRFEEKRAVDVAEIHGRMQQVEIERAYRIIGVLEKTAKRIENEMVPRLREALRSWKRRVLWADGILLGAVAVAALSGSIAAGWWQGLRFAPPWLETFAQNGFYRWGTLALVVAVALYAHFGIRGLAARSVLAGLRRERTPAAAELEALLRAFRRNTRAWRPLLLTRPAGWTRRSRRHLARVLADADSYVQTLNDRFTDPSGGGRVVSRDAATVPRPREADADAAAQGGSAAGSGERSEPPASLAARK